MEFFVKSLVFVTWLICRILVYLSLNAKYNLGLSQPFFLLVLHNQSLGAPSCDLRGQNGGQILNQHKILYKISLSQLKWWPFY